MKLLILSLTLAFTACTQMKPAILPIQTVMHGERIILDARDSSHKKTEMLSYIATNCQYGIQRLGDEWTTPNRITYTESVIKEKKPDVKEIKVIEFVTFLNVQRALRNSNIYRGEVFKLMECNENTDRLTHYTPQENPTGKSVVIGTISVIIDGREFSERALSFPMNPSRDDQFTVFDARATSVRNVVTELVERVSSKL